MTQLTVKELQKLSPGMKDGNVPDEGAEHIWSERGPRIRAMVEDGRRVLFHCRAGRGRSGMMKPLHFTLERRPR